MRLFRSDIAPALERTKAILASSLDALGARGPQFALLTRGLAATRSSTLSDGAHWTRPQLVLLGRSFAKPDLDFNNADSRFERFVAGTELMHVALLIKDDVMDHASLRRGLPTLSMALRNHGYDADRVSHLATTLGDVLLVQGLTLCGGGNKYMLEACVDAGIAQFHDLLGFEAVEAGIASGDSLDAFEDSMIYGKSSMHTFTAPLLSGMTYDGGVSEEDERDARAWGSRMGEAFMRLDDLCDMVLSPMQLGKDTLADFRENRPSTVVFDLKRKCDATDWDVFSKIHGNVSGRRDLFFLLSKYNVLEDISAAAVRAIERCRDVPFAGARSASFVDGLRSFEDGMMEEILDVTGKINAR